MTNETESPRLAPCPFCGAPAKIEDDKVWLLFGKVYRARCIRCFANTDWRDTPTEAAQVWNMRQ